MGFISNTPACFPSSVCLSFGDDAPLISAGNADTKVGAVAMIINIRRGRATSEGSATSSGPLRWMMGAGAEGRN